MEKGSSGVVRPRRWRLWLWADSGLGVDMLGQGQVQEGLFHLHLGGFDM